MEIYKIVNIGFWIFMVILIAVAVWVMVSRKDVDFKGGDRKM